MEEAQNEMLERIKKSYYKPVAGRKKLSPGKKARAENKGSTEFEMELVHYLDIKMESNYDGPFHTFRSPASKTPVDVWLLQNVEEGYEIDNISRVRCYQCKTTRDTSPPKINKKEFDEFVKFVNKIGAKGYWADRWKKNKNVYIRRIRGVNSDGRFYVTVVEDFSYVLKKPHPLVFLEYQSSFRHIIKLQTGQWMFIISLLAPTWLNSGTHFS